jgi:hypothetical protein
MISPSPQHSGPKTPEDFMSNRLQPNSIQTQSPYSQTEYSQAPHAQAPHAQAPYPQAPYFQAPNAAAPLAASGRSTATTGLPWFIIGATLLVVGMMQGIRIPEMMQYKSSDAVVGNLTGVVALFGIGAALLAVGFVKRRPQR